MRFIVENFGPIEKADITLKNLNVFIGKNSSGKSYLAYLIWALLSVEPNWKKLKALFDELVPNDLLQEAINKAEELHEELDKKKDAKKCVEEIHEINEELSYRFKSLIIEAFKRFDDIWGENLESLLKDSFFVDNLAELVRVGHEKSSITISDDRGEKKIHVEITENGLRSWINEKVIKEVEENLFVSVISGKPVFLSLDYVKNSKEFTHHEFFTENYQAVEIIPVSFGWIFDGYTPYYSTFIAPDGRTGLIRSTEAYNYALISGRVTINEVDRIFVRDYMSFYPKVKKREINDLADFIENKLGVKYFLRREPPRFLVQIGEIMIPIQRAPSGYRELAPIIYAMRYKLDEDDVIFVEEPEAHLHPDAQVIVTRGLAGLSNYCYVVITTHSITVLDEVSNLLKLKKLPSDVKRRLGYEEWEGLSPESIGVFLFSDGKVEELEVYEDGIEESSLDRVIIEIANLHTRVEEEYEHSRRLQTQE